MYVICLFMHNVCDLFINAVIAMYKKMYKQVVGTHIE